MYVPSVRPTIGFRVRVRVRVRGGIRGDCIPGQCVKTAMNVKGLYRIQKTFIAFMKHVKAEVCYPKCHV